MPRLGTALDPAAARGTASDDGELCASLDGFSLHARIRVGADERERLEHLCRYVCRPALAGERLALDSRGYPRWTWWYPRGVVRALQRRRSVRGLVLLWLLSAATLFTFYQVMFSWWMCAHPVYRSPVWTERFYAWLATAGALVMVWVMLLIRRVRSCCCSRAGRSPDRSSGPPHARA